MITLVGQALRLPSSLSKPDRQTLNERNMLPFIISAYAKTNKQTTATTTTKNGAGESSDNPGMIKKRIFTGW